MSASDLDATDVVVVGAGPTGLMAACLLARSGASVRIVDKSPTAAKESRAFGIQPRSMELFESIGLAEALLDRGLMASGAQIFVDGRRAAELNFDDIGRDDTSYQFILMVPQSEIEEVLVGHCAELGVTVERGVEVTGVAQDETGIVLHTADTLAPARPLRGRYVIGADGAHSIVRKSLGLSFEGAAYPQTFLLADCKVEWPLDYDHLKIMLHGRGFGLYLPLKGRDLARIMAVDPHPPVADGTITSQGSSAVSLEEVGAAFRDAAGVDVGLSGAVWTSRYRVHHRGVDRYRVGRAFVAGDAAHIHSPAGGQGMNTGLQDAANLAWKLALVLKGKAPDGLLDTYHAERWPVGQKVLTYTDKLFSFATAQTGWAAAVRQVLFPLFASTVSRVGTARARAFHFLSELGIRYKESEFVLEPGPSAANGRFRAGPSAGHRAPNATIGRNRDLFGLLEGYRFTLLALSNTPLGAPEIAKLCASLADLSEAAALDLQTHIVAQSLVGRDKRIQRAESGRIFDAYGLDHTTPQALYVVRPDGYVAWRTPGLDVEACRAYLLRFQDVRTGGALSDAPR